MADKYIKMKNHIFILTLFSLLFSIASCNIGKKSGENIEPYEPVGEDDDTMRGDFPSGREEVLTVWIGPDKVETQCFSPMAPPSCREIRHQVQYDELDKSGVWEPFYDFYELPDFETGYVYQVQYTKVYMSKEELRMIADHHGFEVKDIVVLSKEKY